MTDAKLKSLAERINRLLDEKQGLGEDIADIFQEAKSSGYVPKVLRKAITRQRMEPAKRQEEDSILELYEAALDGPTREAVKLAAQGATSREIESATGLDHSTVARSVALKKNGATKECGDETGVGLRDTRLAPCAHRMPDEEVSAPNSGANSEESGDRQGPVRDGGASADVTTVSASSSPPTLGPIMRELAARYDEPDLTIPAHPRRIA